MIHYNDPNQSYIPDHPHRILIINGSGSGKTNVLLNVIKHQRLHFDKIYLYVKDPFGSKYQLLINGRKKVGIKTIKNPKAFIDYSQTTDAVYENLENYKPTNKMRIFKVFDDTIADMKSNKKLSPIVTELLLRGRKLNIQLVFISQSYFKVLKNIRRNATHYFITKLPIKRELQQITSNHSPDIDLKYFMKLYKDSTKELYYFLVNDTTLSSGNPLQFRKTYYKMSISEKSKTIDNKIEQNIAHNDLDRQTAKISVLSSGNVRKYGFLTGKDVLPEKGLLQKAATIKRFECRPLGKELKAQTDIAKKQ